jgi:hypothetical protein
MKNPNAATTPKQNPPNRTRHVAGIADGKTWLI